MPRRLSGPRTALAALWLVLLAVCPATGAHAFEIRQVVSPGGIEAWLVEDHSLPVIALGLAFRGGGAADPAGKQGRANMVSGLLDEGAGDLDSQAFQRRLADLSISLSFDASLDSFSGSLRTLTRNRDEAFDMLRLALTEPRFDAKAVERIRAQILAGLAGRANDPGWIANRTFWAATFPDHPYGRPVDGTPESVRGLSAADLRAFVEERFARDDLVIGVVGDITAEQLAPLLDATFGDLPAHAEAFAPARAEPATDGGVMIVEQAVPQSRILFGQPGIYRDDPDFYAALVLNQILGGGSFTSRLYDEVREKRGLAYAVYSYLVPLDFSALWMGGAGTENAAVGQTVEVIRDEWRRLRDEPVTAEELAAAKDNLIGSYALRFDSTTSIADVLVAVQLEELGIGYIDGRDELIEAVTAEDVRRVAGRLLDPEALTFVIVGQPEGVTATRTTPGG